MFSGIKRQHVQCILRALKDVSKSYRENIINVYLKCAVFTYDGAFIVICNLLRHLKNFMCGFSVKNMLYV